MINLLTVGLSSFLMKNQVPSDIPSHGQFIAGDKLKSQEYLNQINEWTESHKMVISEQKTKALIFNFTDNYQFTTRLDLKGKNIELVDQKKISGHDCGQQTLMGCKLQSNNPKSKCKNATDPRITKFWCNQGGNGTYLDIVLQKCPGAVMCGLGHLYIKRKH